MYLGVLFTMGRMGCTPLPPAEYVRGSVYPLQAPAPGGPQKGAVFHGFAMWQVEEKSRYAKKSISLLPHP